VMRDSIWGGLPISLPAMGVFAFLLFRGLDLALNRDPRERTPRVFLAAASALPLLTSIVFGYISLVELDAACKLCIGIYGASLACFLVSLWLWRQPSVQASGDIGLFDSEEPVPDEEGVRSHALSFGQGVGFVVVPALVYLIVMPDYTKFIGTCGNLAKPEDSYGVMVPIGANRNGAPTIEVFDPLCPSCRAFEKRLDASGLGAKLNRKALMFPLDNTCNWMVGSAVHPGACVVSQAVICAGDKADAVIAWAFANQEKIKEAAVSDPAAAGPMVAAAFPELKSCIDAPATKTKLNRSLRWAVQNQLPVLTPQLYVDGVKLCDEDTDLGMDWALSRLLEQRASGKPTKEAK